MQTLVARSRVDQLLGFSDAQACRDFLLQTANLFTDDDLQKLKTVANQFLRADLDRYLQIGDMLACIAEVAQNEAARALSLLIQANACSVGGLGEYAKAVELYDEAASIYARLGRPLDQARSQVGRVFALTHLGRHAEAEATAEWASTVLEAHEEWLPLAKMVSNLGISYSRRGDDAKSLAMFDRARDYTLKLDAGTNSFLPNVEHNRSIALRDLGRYEEAMVASERARELHSATGNKVEAARALQSLATIYFVLGRYNEALTYLDQARNEFADDGRARDTMRAELYIVECLVQLRRFDAALEKCTRIQALFSASGEQYEVAQAMLYAAVAQTGLGYYAKAWDALEEARALFCAQGNDAGDAAIRLRQSHLLYLQERYQQSAAMAAESASLFSSLGRIVDSAFASVAHARALEALGRREEAYELLSAACALGKEKRLPDLCQRCHYLLGVIERESGERARALREFDLAIEALELLRGRLMVEFRAGFLEDRDLVYADAVQLCVADGEPERAITYVERAKSRALIELMEQKLDLGLRARSPTDKPLLDELTQLRNERERLLRRWEGNDDNRNALLSGGEASLLDTQAAALPIENRITELWHSLLIRNADYAQDAALWRARVEPFRELVPDRCILLEYYSANGRTVLFEVTQGDIRAHSLEASSEEVRRLLELLHLNLATAPALRGHRQGHDLTIRAQRILRKLYDWLLGPVSARLAGFQQIIFVPHGALHYLPFHALYDGERYVLETHEVSYLPSGSFLRYCSHERTQRGPLLAFGHSYGGTLPGAPSEAEAVAALVGGSALVEAEATKQHLIGAAEDAGMLHLAAHGEFRPANPLFSGLYLDDGWLTSLDIFNLKLSASLVTLSACQTGRNTISGGDELLGLMRAFLSAGVESLVLTQWRVEDRSTASVMGEFYAHLAAGDSKGASLRKAQLDLLAKGRLVGSNDAVDNEGRQVRDDSLHSEACSYAHPYYWAPFFLVGNTNPLPPSS
ncbi:MAG: CHAT domain-containing protein [Caldilineaceae bacterium]